MSQSERNAAQVRAVLYDTMRQDLPFEEKAERALSIGKQFLSVDNAHLTQINTESNFWKTVASTDSSDDSFPPGLILELGTTYCRRAIAQNESIALHNAPDQGWDEDPAFQAHELHCYHGTPIFIDDEVYGTVCFVSEDARAEPFTEVETMFAELVARMVEHELHRERTEKKLERLDQFAGVLSHDLRNPLNVATGWLDVYQETNDRGSLNRVATAHERIGELITDILTITRQGHEVEETEEVSLDSIVTECWESIATDGAAIEVVEECMFRADPKRCQQLLENLFRNALDHGGANVTVRVGPLPAGDGLYVEDDGPGIPEAQRQEIFTTGYSTGGDGIGLGLSIVEAIVLAHGWTIRVTNSSTGGARFEIDDVVVSSQLDN